MQRYSNSVLGSDGRPVVGATVTVLLTSGATPTLYSDNGTTALASNTRTTDSSGEYFFYAANGRYNLTITAPGFTSDSALDALLFDPADAGADEIGYTPAGVDAIATTVQAKLRRSVEAEDFGAVADGSTNDTTAIQNAIDTLFTAGGGCVQLQIGKTYRIDGTLYIKSGVVLGNVAGMWDTYSTFTDLNQPATARLLKYGTGNVIEFYHGATADTTFAGGGIVGIAIDGTNQTSGGGVYCTNPTANNSYGGFIRQCIIEKCYAFGVKLPISTYSMDDFKIIETMVEGTRSTASGEGSGIINYATDTVVRHVHCFRNARHGVENYGAPLRMLDVDSFYNDQCGVYDAGQGTKGLQVQTDANGTYGIDFEVSATLPSASRQHVYTNCLSWRNNTTSAANGRNVKYGQTAGGAGLTNISFANSIFGAPSGETVEYHLAADAAITGGQNRFVNCQFYDTTASAGTSLNDHLWKMSFFEACGSGTEQKWRKPTTLASGTTIPTVQLVSEMVTANATPTTITNFSVGRPGQTITLMIADANTTIDFTGTNLKGNGGVDWAAPNGGSMTCTTPDGTTWYCRIS